jgi:hypothetical protein
MSRRLWRGAARLSRPPADGETASSAIGGLFFQVKTVPPRTLTLPRSDT